MQSKIHIGQGTIETGVFASVPIQPGEVIFFVTGKLLTFQEVMSLPGEGDRTIQIGADLYVNPGYPAEFINHACEPNAGIRDDLAMIALEFIEVGREIRFDYSTCIQEGEFRMECRCQSPVCRKWIGDFSDLPEELKLRYIRLGVVQPFILDQYFQVRRRSALEIAYTKESGHSGAGLPAANSGTGRSVVTPSSPQPLAGIV